VTWPTLAIQGDLHQLMGARLFITRTLLRPLTHFSNTRWLLQAASVHVHISHGIPST
jgi:hypothetical protein